MDSFLVAFFVPPVIVKMPQYGDLCVAMYFLDPF
jgi:hypothetical protein